jgi:hypothetical protein
MLKGLSAILAAAVCAGIVVGFVPQPEPAAAAATPRPAPREQSNVAIDSAPVVAVASACTQTWPYYEQSCLRDGRQAGRTAPTARIIPSTYPVKAPALKNAKLAGGPR